MMKIEQRKWTEATGCQPDDNNALSESAQLVLIFGATSILADNRHYPTIRDAYPHAHIISCVGRKLVLKQRTEEEVEGVRDVLGARTGLTGFYPYSEISPFTPSARCELHNQTMIITTFSENR